MILSGKYKHVCEAWLYIVEADALAEFRGDVYAHTMRTRYEFTDGHFRFFTCSPEEATVFENNIWLKAPDKARAKAILLDYETEKIGKLNKEIERREKRIEALKKERG